MYTKSEWEQRWTSIQQAISGLEHSKNKKEMKHRKRKTDLSYKLYYFSQKVTKADKIYDLIICFYVMLVSTLKYTLMHNVFVEIGVVVCY